MLDHYNTCDSTGIKSECADGRVPSAPSNRWQPRTTRTISSPAKKGTIARLQAGKNHSKTAVHEDTTLQNLRILPRHSAQWGCSGCNHSAVASYTGLCDDGFSEHERRGTAVQAQRRKYYTTNPFLLE